MRGIPVFVTVDTEEDNWGDYACREPATTNIAELPAFQALCERVGAVPTYLANWPVAADAGAAATLRDLTAGGRGEIGTHIHPWNTPPLREEPGVRTSMLCNLPPELIRAKLAGLHARLTDAFGRAPVTFRAGRWGFSREVAVVLAELGYAVDSSVSPSVDWSAETGPDYRRAPEVPYRFQAAAPLAPATGGALLEVPVTIGFIGNPRLGAAVRAVAERPLPRRLRMVGLVDRLGLATKRWLSPEVATGGDCVRLAERLVARGATALNFTFHSPTLVPGLTPFVRTAAERRTFVERIERFLTYARDAGARFAGLSEAPALLRMP